jgi:hypothetical protein
MSKPTASPAAATVNGNKATGSRYRFPPPPPEGEVYAILIPCDGDKQRLRTPPFIPIHVPPTHGVFQLAPTPVSSAVGFPLIVCQIHSLPVESTPRQLLDNQIATYLCIDTESGFAPAQWQSHVGTVVVARKDGKSLDSRHFEAMWQYCDHILDEFGEGDVTGTTLRAEGWYTKDHFKSFVEVYAEGQTEIRQDGPNPPWDQDWRRMPPVFDA